MHLAANTHRTAAPVAAGGAQMRAGADAPLFRSEALAARQTNSLGVVLLDGQLSHRLWTMLALSFAAALLLFVFFGTYTRKEKVNGWLVPRGGLVRVFAPQAGVVGRISVREGSRVQKGAALLTLSAEVQSETAGATRQTAIRRMTARREILQAESGEQDRLFEQQSFALRQRLATVASERLHLARELDLARRGLHLSDQALARERLMRARDLISEPRLRKTEQDRLEQAAKVQSLERGETALAREAAQTQGAIDELPFRRRTRLADLGRQIEAVEQEIAEAEARREIVVTAPHDGVVSGIQVEEGGAAPLNVPLLSLVPAGSDLQAHLFAPSSAVGFLRQGQTVLLRYPSFPYQKFGTQRGVVTSVSRSAISPTDLPQQLAGATSFLKAAEPVYRVMVDLDRQSVLAYGERLPLQPSMRLDADIMIESRRLIEWILDPLYTLSGR